MNELFDNDCTLRDKLLLIRSLDDRRNRIDLKIGTKDGSAYIFCGADIDKALDKMKDFLNRKVVEVYQSIDRSDPYPLYAIIIIEGTEHGRHWFEGDDKMHQQGGDVTEYGTVKEKRYFVSFAIRDADLPNKFTMNWATDKKKNKKKALKSQEADLKRALETAYELGYDFSCKEKIVNAKGPDDIAYIMHALAVDDYI